MRIIANKILTRSQYEDSRVSQEVLEGFIKMDLASDIAKELYTKKELFSAQSRGRDFEYTIEAFVFSPDTYKAIMIQLRGLLSEGEYLRVRNILINQI
jgi:hypothetical protein